MDLNSSLRESGVSSVDFVNFTKVVAQEFNLEFKPEECVDIKTVGELIQLLESRSRIVPNPVADGRASLGPQSNDRQ